MSGRDVFRSFVRSAGRLAERRFTQSDLMTGVRRVAQSVRDRQASIPEAALSRALAHTPGFVSATVTCRDGRVRVHASTTDGALVQVELVPRHVRFAPQGAKELVFGVQPPEALRDHRVSDLAGVLGASIAHALWGLWLRRGSSEVGAAIVDREGDDALRIDLRTTPAVRAHHGQGPTAMLLEVLSLGRVEARDGALVLEIALPDLGL